MKKSFQTDSGSGVAMAKEEFTQRWWSAVVQIKDSKHNPFARSNREKLSLFVLRFRGTS